MANEVLRLKNDVLNELRNQKYYTQDELRTVVDNTSLTQREKVASVIEIVSELVNIDAKIQTVEAVFVTQSAQTQNVPAQEPVSNEPRNVVEGELNQMGQTHSE